MKLIKNFDIFLHVAKAHPKLLIFNVMVMVLLGLSESATIISLAPIIDTFRSPDYIKAGLVTKKITNFLYSWFNYKPTFQDFVFVHIGIVIIKNVLDVISNFYCLKLKYKFRLELAEDGFRKIFKSRWSFFQNNNSGHIINTFNREISVVADGFGAYLKLARSSTLLVFCGITLFGISWKFGFASMAVYGLAVLPSVLAGRLSFRLAKVVTESSNRIQVAVSESLLSAKSIISFGKGDSIVSSLGEKYDDYGVESTKSQMVPVGVKAFYEPFFLIILFGLMWLAMKVFNNRVGDAITLLYSLRKISPLINTNITLWTQIKKSLPSYDQLKRLVSNAKKELISSGEELLEDVPFEIEISQLSFSYKSKNKVLNNLSLKIPAGKKVAFVGSSGAGKTTLSDMILGILNPDSGTVLVNGKNRADLDEESFRSKIGFVSQECYLFSLSIKENISWGDDSYSMNEIEEACRKAYAHDFIEKLPNKYETVIGEDGVQLSGGQKQRISMARALLRKPRLLILDEATSALDSVSERLISRMLEELSDDLTVITIAHRFSTIQNVDIIFVLENGQIKEQGNFQELIHINGSFKKFAQLQGFL